MHKYEVVIYWSYEDDAFIAEVPELPGCSAHGDTESAALRRVEQAAELWLDTAREFGDPVPPPVNA
ncbi:MAG: type II toxin-antitoxin system HicB family antitoxin [Dehalococcoidia bacterium]|nr:type II toxin-antitoxin system HicB family antitoxin [Dehalococcoidia bacterium]